MTDSKQLIIFSPFSNIWDHTFPEALVASGLRKEGWDVSYINCDGLLSFHCVAMSAASIDEHANQSQKDQICKACHKRRNLSNNHFGFENQNIEAYITSEITAQVQNIIAEVTPSNWTEVSIDDVPLGRYAIYEMWLNNKLVSTEIPKDLWPVYVGQLTNTLNVYLAAKRLFENADAKAAIVYNDHYSVNHAFVAAASKYGVDAYSIHGGWHMLHRAESLSMMKSSYTMADIFKSNGWKAFRSKPIDSKTVDLVSSHFDGLWAANSAFAYSSGLEGTDPETIRAKFEISSEKKVLLASMSSEDEISGVELIGVVPKTSKSKSLFLDQISWIKFLIRFAKENQHFHLIIRLHPRMFPNKREQKLSPVVAELMSLRDISPSNVSFNIPQDQVGLYDLAQIVDVSLNYKSSVGAEMMALGIPVVVPSNTNFYTYPDELNKTANSIEEFESLINEASSQGWTIENARKAFRWYGFLFDRVSVNFSETYTARPTSLRPKKPGLRLFLWKKMVHLVLQYGPLIREKISLRRKPLPKNSILLFSDVLERELDSVSESDIWEFLNSNIENETASLNFFFNSLIENKWSKISDDNSLAGRIKDYLRQINH